MPCRFVAIWFRHLMTDWFIRKRPELKGIPFILAAPEHGRMIVRAISAAALVKGVQAGMAVADCRAILPSLQVYDDMPEQAEQILRALAEWSLRFSPAVAIDLPDGLLIDASGCPHLWGGEHGYVNDINSRLEGYGYNVQIAMADTVGAAWAMCRFGQAPFIMGPNEQVNALLPLPPAALRLNQGTIQQLHKLGLYQIRSFIRMPRRSLYRRFGSFLLTRIDQAIGTEKEVLQLIQPIHPYQERLPCMEPIRTGTGIEIGLKQLLDALCKRLLQEEKGIRTCRLRCYRIDNTVQQIEIATGHPSRNTTHLFRLFEIKVPTLQPALGFELFILEAPVVENVSIEQEKLWASEGNKKITVLAELLDRIAGRVGAHTIHRYLPAEHHWPEYSITEASSLDELPATLWRTNLPRPVQLLPKPEAIEVTVQMPDYPPMLFRYKGKLHTIVKADGPERIEREWWREQGLQRDYYCVEDEHGGRYWLFRLGRYDSSETRWFIHGFFA